MFQKFAYQLTAFQTAPATSTETTGHGDNRFTYTPYFQQRIDDKKEVLRRQKTELEKLDSVLAENQRKAALAAESRKRARLQDALRLERLENEYLSETNRLLLIRAGLLRNIRANEQMIIAMIAMRKRRMRAINWRPKLTVA